MADTDSDEAAIDSDPGDDAIDIFQEPEGYFKPKQSYTHVEFELADARSIPLRLVGESPLWAHHLWNGARILADHLQQHVSSLVVGRTVLELGAGAGLPSLVCAIHGAKQVVVTDYPDPELIDNLQYNVSHCPGLAHAPSNPQEANITAIGYLWGADVQPLLAPLARDATSSPSAESQNTQRFDTLLLADVLYNHSEHHKLVRSIRTTLARSADARALVFFTPYRPWLLDRDMAFFDLLKSSAAALDDSGTNEDGHAAESEECSETLGVKQICKRVMPKAMFENDRGDETLRRTVFGYQIFWADLQV